MQLFVRANDEFTAGGDPAADLRTMPSYLRAIELWGLQSNTNQTILWTV